MRALLVLSCILSLSCPVGQADGKLRQPDAPMWFVEPTVSVFFPLTELDNPTKQKTNAATTWAPRAGFGVAAGARVWKPLNLDVGLRTGISFQTHFSVDSSRDSFEDSLKLLELVPYARGTLFPFNRDDWGLSLELGLGMLLGFGGKIGANDFPDKAQMMLRIRAAFGAVWMFKPNHGLMLDAVSIVTDLPLTDHFQDEVGTVVTYETRVGYQFRF